MENTPWYLVFSLFYKWLFTHQHPVADLQKEGSNSSLWTILGHGVATQAFTSSVWALGGFGVMSKGRRNLGTGGRCLSYPSITLFL